MERIRRLEDENIIIVTNNVKLTADVVEENRAMCRKFMQEMTGPVVIIIDFREVKTSFADVVQIIKGNQSGNRTAINQRAFSIFVGTDRLIGMIRDSMRKHHSGEVLVPYFADMDKAIEAARFHLEIRAKDESA